jgi:hypothetical protein
MSTRSKIAMEWPAALSAAFNKAIRHGRWPVIMTGLVFAITI